MVLLGMLQQPGLLSLWDKEHMEPLEPSHTFVSQSYGSLLLHGIHYDLE